MTKEHPQSGEQLIDLKPDPSLPAKPADSADSYESLYRPVKNIRENVKVRAMALVAFVTSIATAASLPVALVMDAVDSQFNQRRLAVDKIKNSDHESAHFLLSVLNDSQMNDIWLSSHGEYTSNALGFVAGSVSAEYRSANSFDRSVIRDSFEETKNPTVLDASKLTDEGIVRHSFLLLAGDAVNADGEGKMKNRMSREFILSAMGSSDIARVKQIFQTTQYRGVAKEVFELLTDRIIEFLSDPGVRRIVDIFSAKLLESGHIHDEGRSIVPMMMGMLANEGVSKEEFEGFRGKYEEMVKVVAGEMRGLVG